MSQQIDTVSELGVARPWLSGFRTTIIEIIEPLASMNTFDLCAIVTMVLLFLYAGEYWSLMVPMRAICLLAVFVPTLRRMPHVWFAAFALMVANNYYDRYIIDNHKYLMTYWVLAMTLAAGEKDLAERDRILKFNGRVLLGLCFAFAVVAKIVSGNYLNGGFFRYTIQLDDRFTNVAWLVGGIDRHVLAEIKRSWDDLRTGYLLNIDVGRVQLVSSTRLSILVWFMTIWTIVIESAVALAFLWPKHNAITVWGRCYLLWIFLFSTYAIAYVPGFAWTLTVMGLAQLPQSHARYRIVYIILVAVMLQVYTIPWVSLFDSYLK